MYFRQKVTEISPISINENSKSANKTVGVSGTGLTSPRVKVCFYRVFIRADIFKTVLLILCCCQQFLQLFEEMPKVIFNAVNIAFKHAIKTFPSIFKNIANYVRAILFRKKTLVLHQPLSASLECLKH